MISFSRLFRAQNSTCMYQFLLFLVVLFLSLVFFFVGRSLVRVLRFFVFYKCFESFIIVFLVCFSLVGFSLFFLGFIFPGFFLSWSVSFLVCFFLGCFFLGLFSWTVFSWSFFLVCFFSWSCFLLVCFFLLPFFFLFRDSCELRCHA